jgi:DNA-binding NarL/FixJ family response regulator
MSDGRIVYVDEDADDIIYFQQFVDGYFGLDVIHIDNNSKLEDVVDEIMNSPPDAVVTDFMLNEKAKVDFNGQTLIDLLQERNKHLPCFLLTSHPPDALAATNDARIVQAKAVMMESGGDLASLFRAQIAKIIMDHKNKINRSEDELEKLLNLKSSDRTAQDNQRVVELDKYIEEHGLGSKTLPDEIKDERSIELLSQLVSKVDALLGKK